MRQWKYFLNGERVGPINEDKLIKLLIDGELPRTITVWTDGMFVWKAVDETLLAEKLVITPPAPPVSPIAEIPIQAPEEDFNVTDVPMPSVVEADTSPAPPVIQPYPEIPAPEIPTAPVLTTAIPEVAPASFTPPSIPPLPPVTTGLPSQPIVPEFSQTLPQTPAPGAAPPIEPNLRSYDPLAPPAPNVAMSQFAATAEPVSPSSGAQLLGSTAPYIEVRPPAPKQFELSLPLRLLVSVIGFGIGYYLVWMLPPNIGIAIAIGSAVGFVCGLLPFFLAKKRNNLKLGRIAVGVCWLSGAAFGLMLALPVAVIFTIVVLTGKNRDTGY